MPFICPATGHVARDRDVESGGPYCAEHGVKWFNKCKGCGNYWGLTRDCRTYDDSKGADFCGHCSSPAPWLSRKQLVRWLRAQVQASDLEPARRLELQEVLDRLADMAADDTRAIAGWQKLRDMAPKVWENTKPVVDILIADGLKKILGL
jgi:hypothetical protein